MRNLSGMWSGDRNLGACAEGLSATFAALWRARWLLALWCALLVAGAALFVKRTAPQFVAHVDVQIAPRTVANDGPEDVRHIHQFVLDSEQAATELEILKSERLLTNVFNDLGLAGSPELSSGAASGQEARLAEFAAFRSRVRCLRLGMSYVFEISYRSRDPQTAARVANALAASYLTDRIESERARQTLSGGAYRTTRAQALAEQSQVSRAAVRTGAPLQDDLFAANARILSPASVPLAKSYPKMGLVVVLAAAVSLISGVLATLAFAAGRSSYLWDAASEEEVKTSTTSGWSVTES